MVECWRARRAGRSVNIRARVVALESLPAPVPEESARDRFALIPLHCWHCGALTPHEYVTGWGSYCVRCDGIPSARHRLWFSLGWRDATPTDAVVRERVEHEREVCREWLGAAGATVRAFARRWRECSTDAERDALLAEVGASIEAAEPWKGAH